MLLLRSGSLILSERVRERRLLGGGHRRGSWDVLGKVFAHELLPDLGVDAHLLHWTEIIIYLY